LKTGALALMGEVSFFLPFYQEKDKADPEASREIDPDFYSEA